jgi:hypothetical protein
MSNGPAETSPAVVRRRTSCRACGGQSLARVLDLGAQPLANAFLHSEAEFASEQRFPLELYHCAECGLAQLVHVVDPEVLFREYVYVTGTSDTIAHHNAGYAKTVVDLLGLSANDLVVEVASNDGSLLSCFARHGVPTLGVEPARNIAALARARGVETVNEFFDSRTAARVRAQYGPARAVIGNNVLAHVDEAADFLAGAASLLAPGGLVIVEVPYSAEMIERLEYDTIYHEHLCYFSVGALLRLCEAAGLTVQRIDRVPVHGGSIRVYAARQFEEPRHAREVLALAESERASGLTDTARIQRFAREVASGRDALRGLLSRLRDEGKRLAAYGAPAKGNTLLNYCGIGTDLIPYTVDKSPHKVGLLTPGMHIPVLPVDAIGERKPDHLLVLAWNFADEIIAQQAAFRERGGRFIVPIPTPVIV